MIDTTRMFDWLAYESIVELLYNMDANKDDELVKADVRPFR